MGNYYYGVSSLPLLIYDAEPLINMADFMEICKSTLSSVDYEVVESVVLSEIDKADISNATIKQWVEWEGSLRNELVKLRGGELGVSFDTYLRDVDLNTGAPVVAHNAFKAESPLDAELIIDKGRWFFLDQLEMTHYFDLEKLIIYSIRLQILERKKSFTIEEGERNFNLIYENIKEAVREA